MKTPQYGRDVLTPDALLMVRTIAQAGSFAAAARQMGLVPSALTYRVRQLEDALDVLLFDRRSRQAKPTAAGRTVLAETERLLLDLDGLAQRVKRVATGWEPMLTLAVDTIVDRSALLDLCDAFYAQAPPTRLKIRTEALSGTLHALVSGQADLAIGVALDAAGNSGLQIKPLGRMRFVFAVAPGHPLANAAEPLPDSLLKAHRAVAVADSIHRGEGLSVGLLSGQDVFTVPDMAAKLQAQLRGIGAGWLPEPLARPSLRSGSLVAKKVQRTERHADIGYAWRQSSDQAPGRALQWWLKHLEKVSHRKGLLGQASRG